VTSVTLIDQNRANLGLKEIKPDFRRRNPADEKDNENLKADF
jgi:hypothetical protein